MSTLEVVIADAFEEALGVVADPDVLHFKYMGRHFRASVHDDFDCLTICDGGFDRWANSRGAEVTPCPVTRDEVLKAVDFLLNTHTHTHTHTATGGNYERH